MVRGRSVEVGVWQSSFVITIAPANAESLFVNICLCEHYM